MIYRIKEYASFFIIFIYSKSFPKIWAHHSRSFGIWTNIQNIPALINKAATQRTERTPHKPRPRVPNGYWDIKEARKKMMDEISETLRIIYR